MTENKKKQDTLPEYDYLKAASSQDCTGLIPALPTEECEIENYEELYPFLPESTFTKERKLSN